MNVKRFGRALGLGAGVLALSATVLGGTADASTSRANITLGSGNYWGVICAQRAINGMHWESGRYHYVTEDGKFGSDTYNGILSFQYYISTHTRVTLTQDGIVGPHTGDFVVGYAYEWNSTSKCYPYVPTTY
jgi:hypothetical protein